MISLITPSCLTRKQSLVSIKRPWKLNLFLCNVKYLWVNKQEWKFIISQAFNTEQECGKNLKVNLSAASCPGRKKWSSSSEILRQEILGVIHLFCLFALLMCVFYAFLSPLLLSTGVLAGIMNEISDWPKVQTPDFLLTVLGPSINVSIWSNDTLNPSQGDSKHNTAHT